MLEKSIIKTANQQNKHSLRLIYRNLRYHIPLKRREESALKLLNFKNLLSNYSQVFSFTSFREEIDTTFLNTELDQEGRLYLPEIQGNNLVFLRNGKCAEHKDSTIILVPAVAFDKDHYRLGYGKGFYDRYLASQPFVHTIGIGFQEQFIQRLPREEHDIQLSQTVLF